MIIQTFFNNEPDSKLLLNICATIARQKKRVLYIDARFNKKPIKRLSNVFTTFSQSNSIEKSLISLEPNLDVLFGSSKTNELDFILFSKLVKGNLLSKYFKDLDYDFIIIEISPILTPFVQNILHFSNQVGVIYNLDKNQTFFLKQIKTFLEEFSLMYSKKLSISKILPFYLKEIKKENYIQLVNDFSSTIVAYPLQESNTIKNKKVDLNQMSKHFLE